MNGSGLLGLMTTPDNLLLVDSIFVGSDTIVEPRYFSLGLTVDGTGAGYCSPGRTFCNNGRAQKRLS